MSQGKRTALIVAGALILIGLILGAVVLGLTGFHPLRLGRSELEYGSQVISEPFDRLNLGVTSMDVTILPSSDGQTRVEWLAKPDLPPQVRVDDGTLVILESAEEDSGKWYEHIGGFSSESPCVAVYLARPDLEALSAEGASGAVLVRDLTVRGPVSIRAASGEVTVERVETADALELRTTSGTLRLEQVTAGCMTLKTSSGDMGMKDCATTWVAAEVLEAESSSGSLLLERVRTGAGNLHTVSGDILLRDCSASSMILGAASGELRLEQAVLTQGTLYTASGDIILDQLEAESVDISTVSGDVRGTLSAPMRYEVQTTSGRVDVPPSAEEGGRCRVITTSGDVKLAQG